MQAQCVPHPVLTAYVQMCTPVVDQMEMLSPSVKDTPFPNASGVPNLGKVEVGETSVTVSSLTHTHEMW